MTVSITGFVFILTALVASFVVLINADTLIEERCFCRKHLFSGDGSVLIAKYYSDATDDTALVSWKCHNRHCVTEGYFYADKKCTRSEADAFTFCFESGKNSSHQSYSDKYSIDNKPWIILDDLGTGQGLVNTCEELCKSTFGLPVFGGAKAATHFWQFDVPDW